MLVKVVTLFLIGIGVLAMFGKLRVPKFKRSAHGRCIKCGRLTIGQACQCKKNS